MLEQQTELGDDVQQIGGYVGRAANCLPVVTFQQLAERLQDDGNMAHSTLHI